MCRYNRLDGSDLSYRAFFKMRVASERQLSAFLIMTRSRVYMLRLIVPSIERWKWTLKCTFAALCCLLDPISVLCLLSVVCCLLSETCLDLRLGSIWDRSGIDLGSLLYCVGSIIFHFHSKFKFKFKFKKFHRKLPNPTVSFAHPWRVTQDVFTARYS